MTDKIRLQTAKRSALERMLPRLVKNHRTLGTMDAALAERVGLLITPEDVLDPGVLSWPLPELDADAKVLLRLVRDREANMDLVERALQTRPALAVDACRSLSGNKVVSEGVSTLLLPMVLFSAERGVNPELIDSACPVLLKANVVPQLAWDMQVFFHYTDPLT